MDGILTNYLLAFKFFFLDGKSTIFDSFDILVELGSVLGDLASLDENIVFLKRQDYLLFELITEIHRLVVWRGAAHFLRQARDFGIFLLV